jgi:RAT1-interacting protein
MPEDDNREPSPPTPPRKRRKMNHSLPAKPSQMPTLEANPPPTPTPQPQARPVQFPIQPLHRFQGASSTIKRPREIAHFSYDENHEYKGDESSISYYHPPEIGTNLCDGFETFRHFEEKEDPHLDSLLRTLVSKEKKSGEKIQADFVTWRGMMTKVCANSYYNLLPLRC